MKNLSNILLLSSILLILFSSCASISGFEEGRALGKSKNEIIASANYVQLPNFYTFNEGGDDDTPSHFIFANVDLNYKHGLTDKLDLGVKLNTNLNFSAFVKYQVVGDNISKFALGTGLELSTALFYIYSVHIPVYMTYYFSESVALNISPRGIYNFGSEFLESQPSYFSTDVTNTFVGGNFGLLLGKKIKYGIDIAYYKVGFNQNYFSAGAGVKFNF